MKSNFLSIALCMMSYISNAQHLYFPDPILRHVLINTKCVDSFGGGKGDRDVDTNDDGAIDVNEALNTQRLLLDGLNIKSLKGISNFKNLITLNCPNNQIDVLELQDLQHLRILDCSNNGIEVLNLATNTNLILLTCKNNNIQHLNLSSTYNIEKLDCRYNTLENLDLHKCSKLKELRCEHNLIKYLNLKNNNKESVVSIDNNTFDLICCDGNEVESIKKKVNNKVFVTEYCSFLPGGKFYTFKGTARSNVENDFCDDNDLIVSNLKLNIHSQQLGTASLISNTNGEYFIPVQDGNHTIKPIFENSTYFYVTPDSVNVSFPSNSDTILQNFCLSPKGQFSQVNLSIVPLTPPARPGFDASYKVVMTNKGSQIENGTLYFAYDKSRLDFVSTDVNPSTQSDGLLSWNFSDLLPFETRYYNVTLNVNSPSETPPVNAGDELLITCNIIDNVFLLKQEVVGSYDPNDKTCLEGKTITPEQVGEYVHYLIRFENTGNYAAENVVVKDVIDESTFDISTLQITDASHESWARINGNVVEFIFENIQLPFDDATNDGYICFKIKTKPTLVLGNELKNEANIYFDYNLPILTNKTNTVVALPTSTDETNGKNDIEIFPNPVSDVLKLSSDDKIIKVEIFDMSGRLVQVSNVVNGEVNLERLVSGTYQIIVTTRNGSIVSKMVKI